MGGFKKSVSLVVLVVGKKREGSCAYLPRRPDYADGGCSAEEGASIATSPTLICSWAGPQLHYKKTSRLFC